MSHMMRSAWGIIALLAVIYSPVSAAEWKTEPPKSHMVIVGVGQFADKQLKPRPSAEEDAKGLYDLFVDPKIGGVEPEKVHLFLGAVDEKRKALGLIDVHFFSIPKGGRVRPDADRSIIPRPVR